MHVDLTCDKTLSQQDLIISARGFIDKMVEVQNTACAHIMYCQKQEKAKQWCWKDKINKQYLC